MHTRTLHILVYTAFTILWIVTARTGFAMIATTGVSALLMHISYDICKNRWFDNADSLTPEYATIMLGVWVTTFLVLVWLHGCAAILVWWCAHALGHWLHPNSDGSNDDDGPEVYP